MRHVSKIVLLAVLFAAGCDAGTTGAQPTPPASAASANAPAAETSVPPAPEPAKGAAWCPALPATFTGDAGDPMDKLPATDSMPKLEDGDGFKLAQNMLCVFNEHMLGLTDKERDALPKVVNDANAQCSDAEYVPMAVGYCHSKQQFIFNATSGNKIGSQGIYANTMLTIYAQSWTIRLGAGPNDSDMQRHEALMDCVFGRVVGGLLKAGRMPAQWEALLGQPSSETYTAARDTGTCAVW